METNTDKTINSGETVERNPDGTFKEGHLKLGGKALGTRDFSTDFDEVIDDLAKENNITKSEVRKILLKVAYKNAKNGVYQYHKDIHDRIYGQAQQKVENTGTTKVLLLDKELASLYGIRTAQETDGSSQEPNAVQGS